MTARVVIDLAHFHQRQFESIVEKRMAAACLTVASKARALVRRMYRGTASLPGESPRRRSGELEASIGAEVRKSGSVITGVVVATAPYARALEFGFPPGRLEARPFLRPALRLSWPHIQKIFGGR